MGKPKDNDLASMKIYSMRYGEDDLREYLAKHGVEKIGKLHWRKRKRLANRCRAAVHDIQARRAK